MQELDRRKALAITPLWRLGFRPFFLGGCLFALLAVPLWLAAFSGWLGGWQPAGGRPGRAPAGRVVRFGPAAPAGRSRSAPQTRENRR